MIGLIASRKKFPLYYSFINIYRRGIVSGFMKVSELKARAAVPEIALEIVSKGEPRKWFNEKGAGTVCNCAAKDDTGEVSLSLWNDQCDMVNEGDKIVIKNGWCNEYKGQLQLSAGRMGTLEVQK